MEKDRRKAEREIGMLYVRMKTDLATCFYCGYPRECLDHVPPISLAVKIGSKEIHKRKIPLVLVPSCGECNSTLGAKKLGTVYERVAYLYSAYQKKVNKHFHGWTREEVAELGDGLKRYVEARRAKAVMFINKLRGVEDRLLQMDASAEDEEQV